MVPSRGKQSHGTNLSRGYHGSTWYQVWHQVEYHGSTSLYLVPWLCFPLLGTMALLPSTWYHDFPTWYHGSTSLYLVPWLNFPLLGTMALLPSTWYHGSTSLNLALQSPSLYLIYFTLQWLHLVLIYSISISHAFTTSLCHGSTSLYLNVLHCTSLNINSTLLTNPPLTARQ